MLRPGRRVSQHLGPARTFLEPARHRGPEHPALGATQAFAGHHQQDAAPLFVRIRDEAIEGLVRLVLGHAVQIEHRLDRELATAQPLPQPAVQSGGGR